jgi:hypothetical protein
MVSDVFWLVGGRQHRSGFVLGLFCSISHDSTLWHKSWTDPTIPSKVLFLYLRGVGAGGALAPSR